MAADRDFSISPPSAWKGLLDATSDLLVALDLNGLVLWTNRSFLQHTGLAAADIAGHHIRNAFAGTDLDARLCGAPNPKPFIVNWTTPEGRSHIGTATLAPWPGDPSEPAAAPIHLMSVRDITRERSLTNQIQRLNYRIQTTEDFVRLGIWSRELPDGQARWNQHMFRILAFDPALGTPGFEEVMSRIHPDDDPGTLYLDSMSQAGRHSRRYRLKLPDGTIRHAHSVWDVHCGEDGTPQLITGVMVDDSDAYTLAESLKETSEQLQLAVELGNIATWRHHLASNRLYYNDRAFQVLDIAPREEGLTLEEIRAQIHPDDIAHVQDAARLALETSNPVDMDARYRRADGSWRYVRTRRRVRRAPDGTPIEFVGVALDFTEQRDRNQQAVVLTRRLETAAAAAGLGLWRSDPSANLADWNDQMHLISGWPRERGVPSWGTWLHRLVHPNDRDLVARQRRSLFHRLDTVVETTFRVQRPNGDVRWVVDRARSEMLDGQLIFLGILMDVTERIATEAALRQAHERVALATHGAGIGTWERDIATDAVHWDSQMYLLRGLSVTTPAPDEVRRHEGAHAEDVGRIVEALDTSLRQRALCSYEFRARMADGSYRWMASRSTPLFNGQGEAVRQIGVNWDIHERVAAQAEREARLIAQQESLGKSEFLARMSHELRTPLNAVLGFTQLLQVGDSLQPEQRHKLRHIQSAGQHLLSLINDVLDLSSLEAGQMKLDVQSVDLGEVLHEALPLVENLAKTLNVAIRVAPVDEVLRVDRMRTRQILLNLLSNAIKYNRPGGQVDVSASRIGELVQLTVKDTGRGMSAEQMSHLFEPFNRLGVERERIEGAGIGLAVVKRLVEHMGGSIQVHSESGKGSCFDVRLPRDASAASTPDSSAPTPLSLPEPPPQRAGQVLYIEDNLVNVLLVEELVRAHAGLSIRSETTGLDGVARAMSMRPDLILIDMQLPDITGFEVLERLRQHAHTSTIPCVALSANAMPQDVARARAAGFTDYWTKPIDFKQFLAGLTRLIPPS